MAADPTTMSAARNADALRERLQAVSSELQRTQQEIQKDAAGLERLRNMLDIGYWNELVTIVNELEGRVREATEMARQADSTNQESRKKLDEEQRRLEKLWDAFKLQERELQDTKERASRLERDLMERDSSKARLEAEVEDGRGQVRRLQDENSELFTKVEDLEGKLAGLQDMELLRSESEDWKAKYEAERERLAKLYALYEESEAEREQLRREMGLVDQWFDENKDALDKVSRSLRWRANMLKRKTA